MPLLVLLLLTNLALDSLDPNSDRVARNIRRAILVTSNRWPQQERDCADKIELRQLCYIMEMRETSRNPIGYNMFEYQDLIYRVSCVNPGDDDDTVKRKISTMWSQNESLLTCTSSSFDIINGSLIKFAICSKFDEFVEDAIFWRLPLNGIDPADGKTVLDYVSHELEIAREQGLSSEPKLRKYFRTLRAAGAKHRQELN